MKTTRKPYLSKRIKRGLQSIYAFVSANQFDDSDLYVGKTDEQKDTIDNAIEYLAYLAYDRDDKGES